MQRLRRGRFVLNHGDADVVRAGIATVGLLARQIAGMLPYLKQVPRRDDAAPPPWSLCLEPWRRGCSPRRDCYRRLARAPDSGHVALPQTSTATRRCSASAVVALS